MPNKGFMNKVHHATTLRRLWPWGSDGFVVPWRLAMDHSPGLPVNRCSASASKLLVIALVALIGLSGCTHRKTYTEGRRAVSDYFAGGYARAQQTLAPLAEITDENFVLNNLRLGSSALANYDLAEAEAAFLRAYEVLNAFGVNQGGRTLGAVLVDEKIRIWRGEPYERAMANFYLGLTYYLQQDWNNARAAFENALFRLRDHRTAPDGSDEWTDVESNFTLALIMLGRCWQKLGRDDLAQANFERARELRPQLGALTDPEVHRRSNVLLVVDYGYGPRKITDFDGAIVGFYPTPLQEGPIPRPRVRVNGRVIDTTDLARPTIDTLAMAQERRWQSMDTIRTVKSAAGTGLIAGGAITTLSGMDRGKGDRAALGIGLMAAGLLLKAGSQADVRQWEMLPRTVFLIPLELPPGRHDIIVDFPGVHALSQEWRGLVAPSEGQATYYMRMLRFYPGPFTWPPPAYAGGGLTDGH